MAVPLRLRLLIGFLITVLALALTVPPAAVAQQERTAVRVDGRSVFRVCAEDLRAAAEEAEGVLPEPAASVRVRELGAADIVLEVRFWADSRRSDLVATQSNVRTALVTAFQRVGMALPTPDLRRVRIENPPPGEGG